MTSSRELSEIIREFKGYFGKLDRNNVIAHVLADSFESKLDSSTSYDSDIKEAQDITDLINMISSNTQGGALIHDSIVKNGSGDTSEREGLLSKINALFAGTKSSESLSPLAKAFKEGKFLKLCTNHSSDLKALFPNAEAIFHDQPNINKIIGESMGETEYALEDGYPTKSNPGLSVIDAIRPELARTTNDASIAALWASGLPSIELAKCVPYLDVKIYDPRVEALDSTEEKLGFNPSAMKFILGGKSYLSEEDIRFAQSTLASPIDPSSALDPSKLANIPSVAGMELFTMPQTYQGKKEQYIDLNPDGYDGSRPNSVIDPFRPFMIINSFDITVESANTVMSVMRGTLSLTLGDRTRLHEVAALIKPDRLTTMELIVEWGWSHPDKKKLYGRLLNASRQKRKFLVATSDYTFNTDGTVGINLKLFAKGAERLSKGLISSIGAAEIEKIDSLVKQLRVKTDLIKSITGTNVSQAIFGNETLGLFTSVDNILTISKENMKKIDAKLKRKFNSKNADIDYKELRNIIMTNSKDGKNNSIFEVLVSYRAAVNKSFVKLEKAIDESNTKDNIVDPWAMRWRDEDVSYMKEATSTRYISFGRLITLFVGTNLVEQGMWDDIQIYFYGFNNGSFGLHKLQISNFPIHKEEFKVTFKLWRDNKRNPSLLQFVGWVIQSQIIGRKDNPAWGLGSVFERKEKKDSNGNVTYYSQKIKTLGAKSTGQKELEKLGKRSKDQNERLGSYKRARSRSRTAMTETAYKKKMTNASNAVYGKNQKVKFKAPAVRIDIETIGSEYSDSKSILKVHIYDAAQDIYQGYTDIIKAMQNTASGFIANAPSNVETGKSTAEEAMRQINKALLRAVDADLLKVVDKSTRKQSTSPDGEYPDYEEFIDNTDLYEINAGSGKLKYFISSNMPTLKYGSEGSVIKNANIGTTSDDGLAMIQLKRRMSGEFGKIPAGLESGDFPMQMFPVSLTLDIVGCPFFKHGQQFFFDFQTNTDIDNAYIVTGITHKISPNDYSTSLKLTSVDRFGVFQQMHHKLSELDMMFLKLDLAKKDEAKRKKEAAERKRKNRVATKKAEVEAAEEERLEQEFEKFELMVLQERKNLALDAAQGNPQRLRQINDLPLEAF